MPLSAFSGDTDKKEMVDNLEKENASGKVFITGNTVIDALLWTAEQPYEFEDETLKKIDFENKRVIAVTCHRRENLGEYMGNIFTALLPHNCKLLFCLPCRELKLLLRYLLQKILIFEVF